MELNDKKLLIIKVAEGLFSEKGYDGTSIREIAKEAKVNIAMISYYFGSKEKLLEILMVYRMSNFKTNLADILNKEDADFTKRLEQVIALFILRIHANRRIYKIIHSELPNNNRSLTFNEYLHQKAQNFEAIEAFIKKGQDEKVFKTNVEIPLLIPTVIGTYFHFHYNLEYFKKVYDLDNKDKIQHYVENTLTVYIQNLLKALLTYEN